MEDIKLFGITQWFLLGILIELKEIIASCFISHYLNFNINQGVYNLDSIEELNLSGIENMYVII